MTIEQLTKLSQLIRIYMPNCNIPVKPEELKEWNDMLTDNYEFYEKAIRNLFADTENEDNKKLINELKQLPMPTIRKIGNRIARQEGRVREITDNCLNGRVELFHGGGDPDNVRFMSVLKRDEFGKPFYEDIKDANGHIIYLEFSNDFLETSRKVKYHDRRDLERVGKRYEIQ